LRAIEHLKDAGRMAACRDRLFEAAGRLNRREAADLYNTCGITGGLSWRKLEVWSGSLVSARLVDGKSVGKIMSMREKVK
jgi:hypothetical protein